ncbi:3-carboxy-cis,cis-muconate cycloisomerase [Acidobacteria bacterium AB60]|nr:3-carboxy-cis,cis-muconate cycloisomerase [Acidobacteria bacterium AB60]
MSDGLNSFLFSTPAMSRVFSDDAHLRALLRFEHALAQALENTGLAVPGASQELSLFLDPSFLDLPSLQREAADAGNIVIPLLRQLTAAVSARNEPASRAIHRGATSQDVLDTALILQIAEALPLLETALAALDAALVAQTRAHADTLLSGRTWLQPGPPVTLGLKLAGILAALRRDRDRLRAASQRALVLQFGGAVGTRASLGDAAPAVSRELARILHLREPELPWHTHRDRLVELVQLLALLTGSLAKFARDIALLMQPEVAEASEATSPARGGSSTMPHKHNPVACAAILAIHTRMPALAATMLHAMPQEHERALGLWQAEWQTVPEAFRLAAAALAYATDIATHLHVDPDRMRANLDALLGLNLSEAVSTALADNIGRAAAHDLLRRAAARAQHAKLPLADVLKQLPEVTQHLSPSEIDRLLDPRHYLGSTQRFIAAVLREDHDSAQR